MKSRYYVILVFVTYILSLTAQQQVSLDEAKKAAINFINTKDLKKSNTTNEIKRVNSLINSKNDTLIYEVVFENKQTVILSGSKACLPVLAYTDSPVETSVFKDEDIPPGLKTLLNEYEEQINLCFENNDIKLTYQLQWENIQTNKLKSSTSNVMVAPLLTSSWGQSTTSDSSKVCNAYNYYVTETSSNCATCSQKCPAGCVAVAMAQIIYYWKNPVILPTRIEQYDWCNMADKLTISSKNYIKERNAIARLIRDCGIASKTNYCSSGCQTGAKLTNAKDALIGAFGYSNEADLQRRLWHRDSDWKSRMKGNLHQGRPILYAGFNSNSGHAFVCDGYDSNDYFHFNWGWSGKYDNYWFTIDNLSPGSNYNSRQQAIFYIHPQNINDYCNYTKSLSDHYTQIDFLRNITASSLGLPDEYYKNIPKTLANIITAEEYYNGQQTPNEWRTIPAGAEATYTAHKSIHFKPGFKAERGSTFTAHIEPCTNCPKNSSTQISYTADYVSVEESAEYITRSGDNYQNNKMVIYPNPNNGDFLINISEKISANATIEIFDIHSKLLLKKRVSGNSENISFNRKGIFILRLNNGNDIYIEKLIVR